MSFVQGFQAGTQMGKTWLDIYNQANEEARKRKYAEEVAGLATTRDLPMEYTPIGGPAAMTPPVLQNVVSPTALGLQPAPAAVSPPMRMPAPAAPVPADRRGPVRPLTENIPESELYRQRAAIASKYGLTDEMNRLQGLGVEAGRYESEQARQARLDRLAQQNWERSFGLQKAEEARAAGDYRARDAETRAISGIYAALSNPDGTFNPITTDITNQIMANSAIRNKGQAIDQLRNFVTTANEIRGDEQRRNATTAAGLVQEAAMDPSKTVDFAFVAKVLRDNRVTDLDAQNLVYTAALNNNQITLKFAEDMQARELSKIRTAIRTNTIDNYIASSINADADESTKAAITQLDDGNFTITEGGKPVPGYETGEKSREALLEKLIKAIEGNPYGYVLQRMAMAEAEAKVSLSDAQTEKLLAEASAEGKTAFDQGDYVDLYKAYLASDQPLAGDPLKNGRNTYFRDLSMEEKRRYVLDSMVSGVTSSEILGTSEEPTSGFGSDPYGKRDGDGDGDKNPPLTRAEQLRTGLQDRETAASNARNAENAVKQFFEPQTEYSLSNYDAATNAARRLERTGVVGKSEVNIAINFLENIDNLLKNPALTENQISDLQTLADRLDTAISRQVGSTPRESSTEGE